MSSDAFSDVGGGSGCDMLSSVLTLFAGRGFTSSSLPLPPLPRKYLAHLTGYNEYYGRQCIDSARCIKVRPVQIKDPEGEMVKPTRETVSREKRVSYPTYAVE